MAEIDKQKEKIGFLKNLFFILLGTLFAIIGYLFNYYEKLNNTKLILITFTSFSLSIICLILLVKIFKNIDKLKDM